MNLNKKVIVICQHFWPEEFRINDICKSWVDMGYEVDVLCSIPNYPYGKFFEGYSIFKKRTEVYFGVNIYRTFVIPSGKKNPFLIFLNYISFPINSLFKIWKLSKNNYDKIIVYQLTPIFMVYPALLMKKLIKKDIYIYIQDLWPESLYSVYNFKLKGYKLIFNKISDSIYKNCDYFITTSKGIKSKIEEKYGINKENVIYIPNWAEKLYEEKRENIELKSKYASTFTIMFGGNIGPAQSFETIINAANICYKEGFIDIKWIIVGDGMTKTWAEKKVNEIGIEEKFEFIGRKPVSSMPEYYDIADVLLVALTKSDLFAITIPGKIQSYLASAKPIIASLDGEGADIIRESDSGFVCEAENAEELARAVKRMYSTSVEERVMMGRNAKEYYMKYFEKENLLNKLTKFLFDKN